MSKSKARVPDVVERALWTAGQTFFAVLLATGTTSTVNLQWKYALSMAVGAAIVSVATTLLTYLKSDWFLGLPFWPDLGVRTVKTFLASLLASWGAGAAFDFLAFDWHAALDIAVIATLGAIAKGVLARNPDTSGGGGDNPSTLSPEAYRSLA